MRSLNLMASPGSMDLGLMTREALIMFKRVNPKGYDDCMTIFRDDIEFDDSFVLTKENARTDYGKQLLLRTGIIRPITESGFIGNYWHDRNIELISAGGTGCACGFFMLEPGCFPEGERQRVTSKVDNFVEQWTMGYYNNFLYWLDNAPDQPWRLKTIYQMLFFNHFPAWTNSLLTTHLKTRAFNYEAQAWRSKYKTLFNILLLIDPSNHTPALGTDIDSRGYNFKWPGLLDPKKALDIADAFGHDDESASNSDSIIDKLFEQVNSLTHFSSTPQNNVDHFFEKKILQSLNDNYSDVIY